MGVYFQQQSEHSECGLACATMIIDFYEKKTNLAEMREKYGVPNGGYNLAQIQSVLLDANITTKAIRIESSNVSIIKGPFIAFWKNKHFIVVEKINKKNILIADPARGKKKVSYSEFDKFFSGVILYVISEVHRKHKVPQINPFFKLLVKNNRNLFLKTFLIFLFAQCINIYIPYVIKTIIDGSKKDFNAIVLVVTVLIVMYILVNFIRTRLITLLQTATDKDMLRKTIKKLLDLPYSYFVNRSKGELIYRINSNSYIRQILIDQVISTIVNLSFSIFYLIAMWTISKILTLITIGITFIIVIFSYFNAKVINKITQNEMVVLTSSQELVNEMINNIFTIKATNSQENMYDKWEKSFDKQIFYEKEKAKYNSILANIPQTIQTFYAVIIYTVGFLLILNHMSTIGTVVAFSTIGAYFLTPITAIMGSYSQFRTVKVYLDRLLDIMQSKDESAFLGNEKLLNFSGGVDIENLVYRYSSFSKNALKGISLHIKPKEKIAIVGASGSGKSTLLKAVSGLYQSTTGNVFYGHQNVKDIDVHELRKNVGVVLQENVLFNGSFRDNITMGRKLDDARIMKAIKNVGLYEMISSFPLGLDTQISEMGQNMSGGQRQKVSIARTIVASPKIIFLDEPTSSLDNISEQNVMNCLFKMDTTLIVVAHRLATIQKFNRIIVMSDGHVVGIGTHQELLNNNRYYNELYND